MSHIYDTLRDQNELIYLVTNGEKKQFFSAPDKMISFLEDCILQPKWVKIGEKFVSKVFKKLGKQTQILTIEQREKIICLIANGEKKQFFSAPEKMISFLERCIQQPNWVKIAEKFVSKVFKKLGKQTQILTIKQSEKIKSVLNSNLLSKFLPDYRKGIINSLKDISARALIKQLDEKNSFDVYQRVTCHDLDSVTQKALSCAITSENYLEYFLRSYSLEDPVLRRACLEFYLKHLSDFLKACSSLKVKDFVGVKERLADEPAKLKRDMNEILKASKQIFSKLSSEDLPPEMLFGLEKEAFEYVIPLLPKNYVFHVIPPNGFLKFDSALMAQVLSRSDIQSIDLSRCENVDEMILSLPSSLRKINLPFAVLNDTLDLLYSRCPNLQELNLYGAQGVDDENMKRIAKFSNLRSLNLGACGSFSNKGLLKIVQNCPNLESFNLRYSRCINDKSLEILKQLHLVSLDLRHCHSIKNLNLSGFHHLKNLDITGLTFSISENGMLFDLNPEHLTEIHFDDCFIDEKRLENFFNNYINITHLSLNELKSSSVLDVIVDKLKLTTLHLRKCKVLSEKFLILLRKNQKHLEELDLEKAKFLVGQKKFEKFLITHIPLLGNLKSLNLRNIPLNNKSIRQIRGNIKDFKCNFNMKVQDIKHLINFDHLERLDLQFEHLKLDFLQPLIDLLRKNPGLSILKIQCSTLDPKFLEIDQTVSIRYIDKLFQNLPVGIQNLDVNFEQCRDIKFLDLVNSCRHLVSLYVGEKAGFPLTKSSEIYDNHPKLRDITIYNNEGQSFRIKRKNINKKRQD